MNFQYSECKYRSVCFDRALRAGQAAVALRCMSAEVATDGLEDVSPISIEDDEFDAVVGDARFAAVGVFVTALDKIAGQLVAQQPGDCDEPAKCPSLLAQERIKQEG
jgi:hypothetical protein